MDSLLYLEFTLVINEFMTVLELKKRISDYFSANFFQIYPQMKAEWL
jgi:hypothetical protein